MSSVDGEVPQRPGHGSGHRSRRRRQSRRPAWLPGWLPSWMTSSLPSRLRLTPPEAPRKPLPVYLLRVHVRTYLLLVCAVAATAWTVKYFRHLEGPCEVLPWKRTEVRVPPGAPALPSLRVGESWRVVPSLRVLRSLRAGQSTDDDGPDLNPGEPDPPHDPCEEDEMSISSGGFHLVVMFGLWGCTLGSLVHDLRARKRKRRRRRGSHAGRSREEAETAASGGEDERRTDTQRSA